MAIDEQTASRAAIRDIAMESHTYTLGVSARQHAGVEVEKRALTLGDASAREKQ